DATAYHLAVAEMYAHIHDTHGFVNSEVLSEPFGVASSPLYLRWIEDAPVVAGFYDEEAARAAGIEIGDIVLGIDGEDALERVHRYAKYIAASTPQALMMRAVDLILSGPTETAASLKVEGRDGQTRTVEVPRRPDYRQGFTYRTGDVLRLLDGNIGYADLDRLTTAQVTEMFERFKDTEAIIFDMRGYPNSTAYSIASYLADEPGKGAALTDRPMLLGPGEWGRQTFTFTQHIPAPGPEVTRYTGKTVMLIDERAISQAEHSGLFFEAANETVFIGSHTNGADGDVTNFSVPGGILLYFTGQSVRHVDGRPLQRLGLVPDVDVKPTVEGIRAGRDEVLEAALVYLAGVLDSQQ
ncbi:MAG TPA: S41 family peptidase, partial [Gemmatimonadales bacterium]|nr:S41 family peptidase [Gemmatimonadales bacterium]